MLPTSQSTLEGASRTDDAGSRLQLLLRSDELAGIAIPLSSTSAGLNPDTTLGNERETGSLRAGKRADLVLMDGRLSVRRTILAGWTVYTAWPRGLNLLPWRGRAR